MRYTLRQRFLRFLGAYVEAVAIWLMERAEPDEPVRMFGCQIVERLWDGEDYFKVEGDWSEHFKTHVPGLPITEHTPLDWHDTTPPRD